MAKKRETRRQERIRKALKRRYGEDLWCFKVHGGPFQQDGIGDIMGVVFGLGFMFEVKEPDGEESELQIETIKDYKRAGGIAGIIIEPEDAFRRIDRALGTTQRGGGSRDEPRGKRAVLRAEDRQDLHNFARAKAIASTKPRSRARRAAKQQG